MLPLEVGCKALITKGKCAGSEVTCIKYIGLTKQLNVTPEDHDCWEIDMGIPWISTTGTVTVMNIIPAKYLMRIDGHEEQTSEVTRIVEKVT